MNYLVADGTFGRKAMKHSNKSLSRDEGKGIRVKENEGKRE